MIQILPKAFGAKWLRVMLFSTLCSLAIAQDDSGDELDSLFAEQPTKDSATEQSADANDTSAAGETAGDEPEPADPPQAAPPRARSRLVEEIVVTAQKREESIRDVPIAITAFSGEKLEALGIQAAEDLERVTPGLTVTNNAGFSLVYLRGIGTDAFLPGADTSVPFYIDSVQLLSSIQGTSNTLGRIERVEVLKGPQGTLFGRNATGGAVSIVTPPPSFEGWTGDLALDLGSYDERNVSAYVSGPLFAELGVSLSAYSQEHQNYYTNDTVPENLFDPVTAKGGRAKFQWSPTDNLDFTLVGALNSVAGNSGLNFELTRPAPLLGGGGLVLPADPQADRVVSHDSKAGAENDTSLYALTGEWRTRYVDFKLIGSTQESDAKAFADFDGSSNPIVSANPPKQISTQDTLELQILSNSGTPWSDRLEWVAGLYYLTGEGGFDPVTFNAAPNVLSGLGIPGGEGLETLLGNVAELLNIPGVSEEGVTINNIGILESKSLSGYIQAGYMIRPDELELILGARYGQEERDLSESIVYLVNDEGQRIVIREDDLPVQKANQLSPKIALKWYPGKGGNQIYASWGRAFKSPTYNTVNIVTPPEPVDEEQVDSYEIGFKGDFFDGILQLNGAAFFIQQENLLTGFVSITSGGIVQYFNADAAEVKGLELDFLWTPLANLNPGLALTGGGAYLDSEYTDYTDGKGYDEATGLAFGGGGATLPARDFTGNEIVRAPKLTYTLGANQRITFGQGELELGGNLYHNSGFFFFAQNSDLYARESYNLWGAQASYFHTPWDLQLSAWVQNLTDTTYNEGVFVSEFGRAQLLNNPRVYGLSAKWTFE